MPKASRRSLKVPSSDAPHMAEEVSRMMEAGSSELRASPAETAQYIAEFTAELSFLARRGELNLLAYLLDVARLEAVRTLQARSAGKK
jgi:hypothetical protein